MPPLLGLVFFGAVFGPLSGCAFDWCWAVHHAMAATSDKPKGLNKMPAQSATEGRSSFRQALPCLLVISSRLQYDAHVCSLRSWGPALLLTAGINAAGSSLGTPGQEHPIGASCLDHASPRQGFWAHNTSGSLLLRHPRQRRQRLRASSSEGQPLQSVQGFGRSITAGVRVTLTPLAKQLFRMQRDLTPSSTYTFAATGNRYASPDMLLPESLSCSRPGLFFEHEPHSGSLTLRSRFVDRLPWTPWTRHVTGCTRQVRRLFCMKWLCARTCASGNPLWAFGKDCTEGAAAFHSALVNRAIVCASFLPFVISRAPGCLSRAACPPVMPRFEATSLQPSQFCYLGLRPPRRDLG